LAHLAPSLLWPPTASLARFPDAQQDRCRYLNDSLAVLCWCSSSLLWSHYRPLRRSPSAPRCPHWPLTLLLRGALWRWANTRAYSSPPRTFRTFGAGFTSTTVIGFNPS